MTKRVNILYWGVVALVSIMLMMPTAPVVTEAPFATASLPLRGAQDVPETLPTGVFLRETGTTSAVWGWVDFCRRNAAECTPLPHLPQPIRLTAEVWEPLTEVNRQVNTAIEPVSDQEHWGVLDSWDIPTDGKGDCEDYVLWKREKLEEKGFGAASLLITVVMDANSDGHAVLTVLTDRGEFILDNVRDEILSWDRVKYRPVKRQALVDPNRWVGLERPAPLARQ